MFCEIQCKSGCLEGEKGQIEGNDFSRRGFTE
jgi:hypothetical protein